MFSDKTRVLEDDKSENIVWQVVIREPKFCLSQEDQDCMGENDEGSCCLKREEALILKVAQVTTGLTSYPEVMAVMMIKLSHFYYDDI